MVTLATPRARAPWVDAQFVGGHPMLDLTNTVFDRAHPAPDNELLKTPSDVLTWCESVGLLDSAPTPGDAAAGLVEEVRNVREHAWAVFDAVSRGQPVPTGPLGALLERSGAGLRAGHVPDIDVDLRHLAADRAVPGAIATALALLAVHAVFTLPADRVRGCGRCGWLFLDSSRGGRRRWCSMSTCGNREKASRHRQVARPAT
ncbi:CGNR zinc finger domain-containing protein [Pseudonocardia cypriaca]|uniref:Putative RNA-binding Zn ribbon-like protein n=1 Tax=Pseudonocardia cypriaca TaxID=882449 RepID=A0A543GGG6_9PSEU|nr:CGNR zinc finger domain-containing protein [Pseudonocardia cypriaca]TQM45143.1 putative RNA-binding Zn ribbon-like protein [Pseudonocardia cypriaca]